MIAFLRGRALHLEETWLVLDVGGVGYEIEHRGLSELQKDREVELWIYTHMREGLIQFFGFTTLCEREVFLSLLKVNGIGPRSAMNILSQIEPSQLITYIESGDVNSLSKVQKVGKKKAEQIVLTLKGKIPARALDLIDVSIGNQREEIVSALIHLGYRLNDVHQIVKELPIDLSFEEGVRRGLSMLREI